MKPSKPEATRPAALGQPAEVTLAVGADTPPQSYTATSGATRQDHVGQVLGDFRLLRRLGEGGMGQVYLAEQESLHRRVAVKLLRSDFAENELFLKRFEAEAKAIAQLTHPNIVQVYAVGNVQGTRYMALEYVDGTNLRDYLNKKGPPELAIALTIMRQIAAALLKAAELGIIHRDIKPENILITRKVEVKVADFGLSRIVGDDVHLTQTGTTMGTPLYMSPEQIMGKPVDTRTDLYSFGATCYHLLTGQPPFMADSAMAVGVRHLTDEAKPIQELRPDLPADLVQLVHRLLAKKPDDRPQTAREVLREIRRIQETQMGLTTQEANKTSMLDDSEVEPLDFGATLTRAMPTNSRSISQKNPRRWLVPVVGGSVMVAIVGGAVIGLVLRNEGHAQTKTASASTLASSTRPNPKALLNNAILELEPLLKQKVEDTRFQRDPDKPLEFPIEKLQAGVRARAELMRYYVYNLDKEVEVRAKAFADYEAKAQGALDAYRTIGCIGQAVLLAHEGKAKESYEALERGFISRANPNSKRMLQLLVLKNKDNKDIVELIKITFKLNEAVMPVPKELQNIKEEIDKIERGVVPDKNRPLK